MILRIRKQIRFIVSFLLFVFLQTYSAEVYALTSGPAQEEYASFEPVGTTDLVNLYTGDFTYNIPLLSVPGPNGGYPINLAYHSGIGMDQEASWVGLGWNVNVGAVNRNLRGLPDDFNGDKVKYQQHMRDNVTVGVGILQEEKEQVGTPSGDEKKSPWGMSNTLQIYYNNYKGLGYRVKFNPKYTSPAVQAGVSLSYDPHEGIGIGASFSVSTNFKKGVNGSLGVSGQYNSRQGLQNISITGSISGAYTEAVKKNQLYHSKNPAHNGALMSKSVTDTKGGLYAVGSGNVTFNFTQGVPATTMAMTNTIVSSDFKLGFTPGTDDNGTFQNPPANFKSEFPYSYMADVTTSTVTKNGEEQEIKSYGYLYNEKVNKEDYVLTDFNHSPFNYSPHIPHVPPSNVTNDIFAATGQGISSVFKAYHSKIGVYSPTKVISTTKQYRGNLDLGILPESRNPSSCPNLSYHIGIGGVPPEIGTATASTGAWEDHSWAIDQLKSEQNSSASSPVRFKPTFFKDMGDRPAITQTDDKYDAWKKDEPIRIDLGKVAGGGVQMTNFSNSINTAATNVAQQNVPTRRTRVIESLTESETKNYGTTNEYKYYDAANNEVLKSTRYQPDRKDHLSEVSILEPDGMRYTYGLPAYNLEQEDASFSVAKQSAEIPNPTVAVPSGGYDKASGEWSKKPEFMDKKKLPAYAHSWMLTSVVSADYVDVTGDGVSADDLGYWVDFKYQKTSSSYHWRAPYEGAIYMPGTTQYFDDKGSYSKGKKELFYLKEIKTKTHVAIFDLKERKDALGASELEEGGKPTQIEARDRMQSLDKIKLYTIEEYQKMEIDPTYVPIPLKVTHFGYETDGTKELCKGVPNREGTGGKLTLKKLWFTYQNSTKGSSSPYVFHYGKNEAYSLKNNDCWGNYKNNDAPNYPHHQFPYTDQSTTNHIGQPITYDVPWHLEQIDLPTGSSMHIEYEQDDYAYVEDKKAMQLYEIVHMGKDFTGADKKRRSGPSYSSTIKASLRNVEQDNGSGDPVSPDFEYKIYFPLKNSIPELGAATASTFYDGYSSDMDGIAEWFKDHYIGETKELYFKAAVKLLDTEINRDDDRVDFVSGYGNLRTETANVHYGVTRSDGSSSGDFDIGYITLYAVPFQAFAAAKDHLHPIRDAAFQHLRFNRPDLVHGVKTASGVGALFSSIPDFMSMMAGYKYYYKIQNWASEIFLDGFSQIRLQVPDGKKRGGGVRVKEIRINDNWEEMTGGSSNSSYENAEYGQIYDYTIEEDGEKISSGVAYEPFAGKEQNPMVVPSKYEHANVLQQPNNLFMEHPIMMAHYPSASVGYRKVTVKSLTAKDASNKRMTTPITEYEFYSPKEFPILFKRTEMDKIGPNYKIIPIPGIFTEFRRYEGVSQGYSLIFNDMAGKPKSITQKTYPDETKGYEGTVISKQEYEYFTDNEGNISSEVDVFTEDGKYERARLGVEVDVQVEANENKESSNNFTLDFNFTSALMPTINGISCIPIFSVASGGISKTSSSLKTAVVQKFVQKKGILKSTTITTQNSTIKTENLVFDALTSEPLLTRTMNEFKDPIYNYTQKAHWHYDGMAAAFKNIGVVVEGAITRATTGNQEGLYEINFGNFPFIEGDEVYVESTNTLGDKVGDKATVYRVSKATPNATNGFVGLAKVDGSLVDVSLIDKITIIRSGRKNLLYAPAGAIVAQGMDYAPNTTLGSSDTLTFDATKGILNASAIKYRDFWPNAKNCETKALCSADYCVDATLYSDISSSLDPEQTFIDKVNAGDIVIKVDGEPIDATQITTEGTCPDTMYLCANTKNAYEVKVIKSANPIKQGYQDYTVNGQCTYKGGDVTIPCGLKHNKTHVDGCPWPHVTQGASCEWVKGYFEADHPTFPSRRPHQEYPCMMNATINQPFFYFDEWPNTRPVAPSAVKYNFVFTDSPHLIQTGWQGYDILTHGLVNFGQLAERVHDHSGKSWFESQTTGELCAYMTKAEAEDMYGHVRLGLRHYGIYPNPLIGVPPLVLPTSNLGGCHPFYIPNSGLSYGQMWYDFKYTPITLHELTLNDVPSGEHNIGGELVTVGEDYDVTVDELKIALPTNEIGVMIIYDPCLGQDVNAAFFNTRGTSIKINVPLLGAGAHTIEIYENGVVKESADLLCNSSNKVGSSVPICNGDDLSYVPSSTINYYNNGTKGNWRPWTSYTYVGERDYNKESIRDKGVFTTFSPFNWAGANATEWQRGSMATKYSSSGYELETVDRLGNHSTALYGYEDNLPVAVAQNARYNEIMFDGFETYSKDCNAHWGGVIDVENVVSTESHTGEYSYKIPYPTIGSFTKIDLSSFDETDCANALAKELYRPDAYYKKQEVLQFLQEGIELEGMTIPKIMRTTTKGASDVIVKALPQACNCLGKFAPQPGKKYTFSAWVKRDEAVYDMIAYKTLSLTIHFNDASGARIGNPLGTAIAPKGSMIEHWQRISGDVLIPSNAVSMEITVFNFGEDVYIDDLRIHPSDAMMTTYVYDKTSLKNTATLDDNNFATFYIYDERGQLEKTKKETTEGIKTITEGRQYIRSNQ